MNIVLEILFAICGYRDDDPVMYCKLYKSEGCSHVDGIFCNFPECETLIKWEKEN